VYAEWSGVIDATGHFPDHKDTTCEVMYIGGGGLASPTVQVTQHAGSDSDKWLLHEIDMDFRNYYGVPGISYGPREINGQNILEDAAGGANYRWLSGNMLIMISYHDSQMTKPEPIEVVEAYLGKHPSTLPRMRLVELRSAETKTVWIKDEMERRLWLCDKWFLQVQMDKVQMSDALRTIVKCLNVFLDYREKYYGVNSKDEKLGLYGYLDKGDGTSIKNKLTEYKNWWNANKGRSINLP